MRSMISKLTFNRRMILSALGFGAQTASLNLWLNANYEMLNVFLFVSALIIAGLSAESVYSKRTMQNFILCLAPVPIYLLIQLTLIFAFAILKGASSAFLTYKVAAPPIGILIVGFSISIIIAPIFAGTRALVVLAKKSRKNH